jgi:tape measure domain-containing protein
MARYTIDFSTNASRIADEIQKVNQAITGVTKKGKQNKITLELDTTRLRTSIDSTFRQLDKQIAAMQRKLAGMQIGSRRFQQQATGIGVAQGMRERGGMQARAIQLGAQAEAFDIGSATRLTKQLEAARIEASQIAPNTEPWINLQRQIGRLKVDLQAADRLAENVQMRESLGAFEPGSLNALEAKLTILRNRAREIAPSATEWKNANREIVKTEQSIEKQTRRPLTTGQRMGAAGGAFLYGGGLGGGVGSAVGGIAGGLMGGVPGAFTGAAIGQLTDNIGAMMASVTQGAATIAQLQRGLALASIDAKDFAEAQQAIRESSDTLVVPIEQVYRQFTQLRVNTKQYNLTVKDTQQILEGVVLAVSSTGGSLQDVDGAMRAVVQIFSKGSVQAEELRGQLGERFPGAVVKFAQANKMSFDELQSNLEQGKVTVGDFVEFAKKNYEDYAKFAERLATGPEFAGRRLEKAMADMQLAIGSALGPAGAIFQDFFTDTIQGFTGWVNQNKEFIGQYLKDWATFVTEFARIVGGIVKIAVDISTAIMKAFSGAIREIRRLLGMVGVAEIKAELDRVNAQIAAGGGGRRRGAAQSGLETRRQQLQAQFAAAGGQAALDAAASPAGGDFVFGGPGAGMSLDAAGGKAPKEKKGKELKDFAEDEAARLREQLTLQKNLIDVQTDLTTSQKELAKAELEYSIGLDIVEAQYQAAIKTLGEYKEGQRGAAQASMQNAAVVARENVTAEYRKKLLGDLIGRSENYETKTADLQDSIAALAAGQDNLSEIEKLENAIKRETIGLSREQLEIIAPFIAKTREQAEAVQALVEQEKALKETLEKSQNLQEARTRLGTIGGGLRAGFTGEAANVFEQAMAQYGDTDYATQLANVETAAMQLRAVFESIQGAINGVSGAFANMLTEGITSMITGTATAKEVFASFLQSVGQALSQAASQMIATYIAIGIAKLFAGLGGGGNPAGSGGGISDSLPGIRQYAGGLGGGGAPGSMPFAPPAFANGGIVTGPTLSLIGEGKYNEAVVPLPDGRSIPVQLGGRSARDMMGNGAPGMPQTPSLSMNFETTKINGVEYVSREQLEQAMAETRRASIAGGAQRGMSMTLDKIKQSPSTRSSIGIR